MRPEPFNVLEKKQGKELYDYQKQALEEIFEKLRSNPEDFNLLYQLPTGGGKTVIFSEIARRYIRETQKKVMILTHRIELCKQTSNMLIEFGVSNKIINSKVKEFPDQDEFECFVAMVETLNNRLQEEKLDIEDIGLVIIDEAHYNSFRKLFKYFEKAVILGVTATPLSSNMKLPMKDSYDELIVGQSIPALINNGFLAKATTYSFDVKLNTLKVGANGDYTVKSSEILYSSYLMQEKLLQAYEQKSIGTKTLIFNNGIKTSQMVYESFKRAGYDIRHLDNTNTESERKEILLWFKETKGAILSSVGILTTGFDEPTVESIILNRATRSLTLYHQMIGRGSRILPNKSDFTVIDLGNNAARFGLWDMDIDWHKIFRSPNYYLENLISDEEIERNFKYEMPEELRKEFKNTEDVSFDVRAEYKKVMAQFLRPKEVLDRSIEQHATMCAENSEDVYDAKILSDKLGDDIESRVRHYSYCICKSTDSYVKWLTQDYKRRLSAKIWEMFDDGDDTDED